MCPQSWQYYGPFESAQTWDKPSAGGALCSVTLNTFSNLTEPKLLDCCNYFVNKYRQST